MTMSAKTRPSLTSLADRMAKKDPAPVHEPALPAAAALDPELDTTHRRGLVLWRMPPA